MQEKTEPEKETWVCPHMGPTTHRRSHRGPMLSRSGGSQRQGLWWSDPQLLKLAFGTRNVSLMEKEPELVQEVEGYQLNIVGLTSSHRSGSGVSFL